jgi:8-oxo-dGTP pyrophosphatase MutT (NUDIX family)
MIPGIEDELAEYLDRHPNDRDRLSDLIGRVARGDDLSSRSDMTGHAVSSILTLDRTRTRGLLIHHLAYGIWIPPGGHLEKGQSLYVSSLRERYEETGLERSHPPMGKPFLLDVDTHPIAARPAKGEGGHVHHDFMYLELCDDEFEPVIQEDEVGGAEWRDLSAMGADGGRMARLVERVRGLPEAMLRLPRRPDPRG